MDIQNNTNNNEKWCCPHCKKIYSKNYKYKLHLKRCLCFKPINDYHQKAIIEIKQELKNEMIDMFRHAIDGLKDELKASSSTKPIVQHILGSMF